MDPRRVVLLERARPLPVRAGRRGFDRALPRQHPVRCPSDPADPPTGLARAHSNTAHDAPFLVILFLYFGMNGRSTTILALIVAATVCRCLLVVGLIAWPTMAEANPLRFAGALGTYVCGAALSLALLF